MTVEEHRDPMSSEVKPRGGAVSPHQPDIHVQTPRLLRAWQVTAFALAIAATSWVAICIVYSPRVAASDVIDVLGYGRQFTHFKSLPAHRIARFEPHSPLPSAGVEVGDLIVDPPRGTLLPGENVQLQIRNGGGLRTIDIRSNQVGQLSSLVNNVLTLCLDALMLVLGITIAFRRRRDVAALAIGCALLLGVINTAPNIFPVGLLGRLWALFANAFSELSIAALAYSVLTFEAGYRSQARPYLVRVLIGFCAIWGIVMLIWVAPYCLGWIWVSPDTVLKPILSTGGIAALLLCFLAFADAWRHIQGEPRQRLRWLIAAMAIAFAGSSLDLLQLLGAFGDTTTAETLATLATDILVAVAIITLTYAVLRHRVIDVGFVISRTLVFAVFAGLLLVLFAAVEWLVDHLVHLRQRESSVLMDGAIAVAIYLIFHRVRNGIERLVERVFFRASHARQTALQHFLDTAPNFSEPNTLAEAFVEAVDAYAGSQGSGIYRRDESGHFVLEKSTLNPMPREVAADAEVIIGLRESPKPYYFGRLGLASPALILPVVRRSELVGFLAVAEKIDRTVFRPDEIESLLRAVHQMNSDFYALQLERFQQRSQELEQQNTALREELRSFGPSSTSLAKTS
jgi:hypothetical protein